MCLKEKILSQILLMFESHQRQSNNHYMYALESLYMEFDEEVVYRVHSCTLIINLMNTLPSHLLSLNLNLSGGSIKVVET